MTESFETSRGRESGAEALRAPESPERTAERVRQVEEDGARARRWRAEGDAELDRSRAEAPALLAKIEPADVGESEKKDEADVSAALAAAERTLGSASRPDLLTVVRELADDADGGVERGACILALQRIAAEPRLAPMGLDSGSARTWAASAADKVTTKKNERDSISAENIAAAERAEADRKADAFLSRLRDANPAAADRAEADYADYRKAAAAETEPLDRRGFLAGWYAANCDSFLAGIPDPAKRETAKADVAGLAETRGAAVDRYLREVAPGAARRMAEASLGAQRSLAGVPEKGAGTVTLEDGRTAVRGERGWVVLGDDGKAQSFDAKGRKLGTFDARRPSVTLSGKTGFPIPNADGDPGRIARESKAVADWEDELAGRGLGFLTGEQLKTFERILADMPSLRDGQGLRFTDAPTPWGLKVILAAAERMLGFAPGEVFAPEHDMRLREDRTQHGFPQDMEPFMSRRMQERGLVNLDGGLAVDLAERAIRKGGAPRAGTPGNAVA